MKLALVIAASVTAILSAVALGATKSAHVAVTATSPTTIQGTGFKAHERVTLTVSAKETRTKRIYAGARGSFTTTFKGLTIPRCDSYTVRAKGNRGSTALLRVIPECAPMRIETTTDPGLPSDPGAPKKHH
jgi:hypothetical protein